MLCRALTLPRLSTGVWYPFPILPHPTPCHPSQASLTTAGLCLRHPFSISTKSVRYTVCLCLVLFTVYPPSPLRLLQMTRSPLLRLHGVPLCVFMCMRKCILHILIHCILFTPKLMVTSIDCTLLELGCSRHGFIGIPLTGGFVLFGCMPLV